MTDWNTEGRIVAVCTSPQKFTRKNQVAQARLEEDFGVCGDAHADSTTHRQVSLLAVESTNKMRAQGYEIGFGDFAENLTTEGIDLLSLPIGTVLAVGAEALIKLTQIGKDCHSGCAISRQVGKCIMPKEGVFGRVIKGGMVRPGDPIRKQEEGLDRQ